MRALFILLLSLPCYADFTGRVVGVTDGDTITVLVEREQVKVRLASIDAPEKRQAWGHRSKEALSELVFGRAVRVATQGKDHYKRTIGRIYVGERDVSAAMVAGGHAWVYRKYSREPELLALEAEARKLKRGLWSLPDAVPPWEWRRKKKTRSGRAKGRGCCG